MAHKGQSASDPFANLPEGITLPYEYQGQIWKVRILLTNNGQHPLPGHEQYYTVPGGSEALYNADPLRPGVPALLVDEELDALLVTQEAKGQAVAVATGGMKTARSARWVDLLRAASLVLVSFPSTKEGDEATQWWMDHLPNAKAWPMPAAFKNISAMHEEGVSVQRWVQSGLEEGFK